MKKIALSMLTLGLIAVGCSSTKHSTYTKIKNAFELQPFENQFTGFLLVDPKTKDTIYNLNSTKYFTPASNTKIFTLFASLKLLPDSIPTLKYIVQNDTLYAQGTGDPAQLHPYLKDSTLLNFLAQHNNIALYLDNLEDEKFGPGWAWDDYHWYYSPERSSLPLYGNVLKIIGWNNLKIQPKHFKDSIVPIGNKLNRAIQKNTFYFDPVKKDTVEIPFIVSNGLTKMLLEKELKKEISIVSKMPESRLETLLGPPSDTLLTRMMEVSDNFVAEQLLLLASSTLSDTLNSHKAREYVLDNLLPELRQRPRWVDGSGLSRYNLFTPESMVHVLEKMYREVSKERLFQFFPAGGVSGTLEDWYSGIPEPYIYAKTGSLGNNHNLSGYLLTKSGKVLIFSFMNNHFLQSSSEIKERMQLIFERIRDTY